MSLKKPPSNANPMVIREWRNAYMRAYRKQLVGTQPVKKLVRHPKRVLPYYIDVDVLQALNDFCATHNFHRRTAVAMALERFFGHRRYKYEIKIPDTHTDNKKYVNDKIASYLHMHLHTFIRVEGRGKKVISVSHVVEQAIRELVLCNVQYPYGNQLEPRYERKRPRQNN